MAGAGALPFPPPPAGAWANIIIAAAAKAAAGESIKTYMAGITVKAPESLGFLAGSSLYAGTVSGFNGNANGRDQNNYYAGLTLNTPVAGLKAGVSYDYVRNLNASFATVLTSNELDASIFGVYASYQATAKLGLHGRAEFGSFGTGAGSKEFSAYTLTAQYDLWQNVISRLEARYDLVSDADVTNSRNNVASLYANIIYKF